MPNWTTGQKNAIEARNRNILVSAAAGSGKTAVLVERVIRLITDKSNPVDIDRLLIVTFTNAAAAEMRFRISKSLNALIRENPTDTFYKRQLSLLPSARICTIDAFCSSIVKEHFYDLSINQDFSTFDESELQLLEDNVISEVLDKLFEEGDKDFTDLYELLTTPDNDKYLVSAIKRLLRFIYAQPFPYRWLDEAIEQYNPAIPFEKSVWYEYIRDEINYLFDYALSLAEENLSLPYSDDKKLNDKFIDTINDDITEITRLKNAFDKSWDTAANERPPKLKTSPATTKLDSTVSQKYKTNRAIYKSILTDDIAGFFISDTTEYTEDVNVLYSRLQTLKRLIIAVDERLMEVKREINTYSFSDIEHFAITLLFTLDERGNVIKTDLANSMSTQFYEILVDEYQDTNEAQDLLFSYLSNGKNLFTVGDIKQSIYRFRLAMPHIFNKRKKVYDYYDEDSGSLNSKIILDKNFRSRDGICSYVNFIFSNLMTERVGELDYNEDEYLNNGALYEPSAVPSAQIKVLNGVKGEDYDKLEATYIAKTIIKKVNSGELIKDGDCYRPVRYGDFAILMRKVSGHIDTYSQVLTEYKIPVMCDNSSNLFENNEIRILLSFIRVIDNPMQDIPLLSTMMSAIYGFTPDELASIRIENNSKSLYFSVSRSTNQKAIDFLEDLKRLRGISVSMSVAAFIRYLIEEKGFIAYINAMGNGELRYQNILKLISFAKKFDNGVNVGLTAFVRYIDKIASSDKGIESAIISAGSDNCVKIMSVHHSKGLEFPICIFAGATRQYNKQDLYDKLLLNTGFGVGLKCHNEEGMYQYIPIPYAVIKRKNANELMSENLRVLYVAMTRAKEQFITFITVDNIESRLARLSGAVTDRGISPYSCSKANNDGDLLLMCALMHSGAGNLRALCDADIQVRSTQFSLDVEITDDIEMLESNVSIYFVPYDSEILSRISDRLSFKYKRSELSNLSSKLTASSLDDIDGGFDFITSAKPSFLNKNGLTPAKRGTAVHTFMQFCDYQQAHNDLEGEISRICALGHLSQIEADSLDKGMLSNFFSGSLIEKILSADKIYREIKVSMFVSSRELYGTEIDEKVLIQGIADLVIEKNGELTLIDFKTDNVLGENELLERYRKQIMFYKSAVAKTLEMPVNSALLYSFKLSKCCYYK